MRPPPVADKGSICWRSGRFCATLQAAQNWSLQSKLYFISYRRGELCSPALICAEFDGRPQVAPTGCALKYNIISAINYDKASAIRRREQAPALPCYSYRFLRITDRGKPCPYAIRYIFQVVLSVFIIQLSLLHYSLFNLTSPARALPLPYRIDYFGQPQGLSLRRYTN